MVFFGLGDTGYKVNCHGHHDGGGAYNDDNGEDKKMLRRKGLDNVLHFDSCFWLFGYF